MSALVIVGASVFLWLLLGVLPERRAERFGRRLAGIPKLGHAASEFWQAIWMYRRRGRSIAAALLLSLLGHSGFVLSFYFAAQIFQGPADEAQIPTLVEHFLLVPIGMTIQALPLAPGGMGVGEYAYGRLYEIVGKSAAAGVLGSLAQRIITWALGLVGYIIYLRMRPVLRQLEEKPGLVAADVQ
jgi:uncharacterized membrane protein YbhN (UPF0104 family)